MSLTDRRIYVVQKGMQREEGRYWRKLHNKNLHNWQSLYQYQQNYSGKACSTR